MKSNEQLRDKLRAMGHTFDDNTEPITTKQLIAKPAALVGRRFQTQWIPTHKHVHRNGSN